MYHFHVADDHPLFRSAILEVIKRHYPDSVVAESMDLDSTIRDLEHNDETDLLLLDLHMPGSQDLFGLILVREKFPSIPLVLFPLMKKPVLSTVPWDTVHVAIFLNHAHRKPFIRQ